MYEISRVTCEHMENPVSIDIKKPRFSWEVSSEQNDVYQSAYQIIVKKETGELVWDSGKTECDHTIEVYYQGEMLVSAQKYFYQIISWNQSGEKAESQTQFFQTAFFETADWEAAWIEPDPLPQLPENPLKRANQRWMDILRKMEFKMERTGLLKAGDKVTITEGVLPSNYYYVIDPSLAMSANIPFRYRLKSREGMVTDVIENARGFYVTAEFDEPEVDMT